MQQKFLALDGLRGFAAVAVAIFHFYTHWPGYLAVDFFLVLSGFVLSHTYLYRPGAPIGFADFISRRLARLYPLHIFTLITWTAGFYLYFRQMPEFQDGTLFTFLQQLTFLHNVGLNPSETTWNGPSWSISVEFWVNVFFILCITRSTSNWLLLSLSLACLTLIYSQTGHLFLQNENYWHFLNAGLLRGLVSFLLGILAYRTWLALHSQPRWAAVCGWLEPVCIAAIVAIIVLRGYIHSSLDMFAPFLFFATVVVFAAEKGPLSWFCARFRYLGDMSYSVYLNHITLQFVIAWAIRDVLQQQLAIPPGLEVFWVYLVLVLLYSHFTYQHIEKPLRARYRGILITNKSHQPG